MRILKEHSEFSLGTKTKWELIRYIAKLEKNINRAIKLLDKMSGIEPSCNTAWHPHMPSCQVSHPDQEAYPCRSAYSHYQGNPAYIQKSRS